MFDFGHGESAGVRRIAPPTMTIHEGQPVIYAGAALAEAQAVAILLHGRGGTAEDILPLGRQLHAAVPGLALVAPQARDDSWYPQRFFRPIEQNEPHLSSALSLVAEIVDEMIGRKIPRKKIIIAGFSQGACLSLEFAVRHSQRLGGVLAFSGALLGPITSRHELHGSVHGTPFFLGCGDRDHHIPVESVEASAKVIAGVNGAVTKRVYPGMGHEINADEIHFSVELIKTVIRGH
jgi:predicted esterase